MVSKASVLVALAFAAAAQAQGGSESSFAVDTIDLVDSENTLITGWLNRGSVFKVEITLAGGWSGCGVGVGRTAFSEVAPGGVGPLVSFEAGGNDISEFVVATSAVAAVDGTKLRLGPFTVAAAAPYLKGDVTIQEASIYCGSDPSVPVAELAHVELLKIDAPFDVDGIALVDNNNNAIAGSLAPGSTFKVEITLAGGWEECGLTAARTAFNEVLPAGVGDLLAFTVGSDSIVNYLILDNAEVSATGTKLRVGPITIKADAPFLASGVGITAESIYCGSDPSIPVAASTEEELLEIGVPNPYLTGADVTAPTATNIVVDVLPGSEGDPTARVYVADTNVAVQIPANMFTDDRPGTITIVAIEALTDTYGFAFSQAVEEVLGTGAASLTAALVTGTSGTAIFRVTAADGAGNTASATLSIKVYMRPAANIAVADRRGVFFSSGDMLAGGAASLADDGDLVLTVTATFSDPTTVTGSLHLDNCMVPPEEWTTIDISNPVISAGKRVYTYTLTMSAADFSSVVDESRIHIRLSKGAAKRDSDNLASAESNSVHVVIDKNGPVANDRDAPEVARVGVPFYFVLPASSGTQLFVGERDVSIVSASAAQAVGLTLNLGPQGVAFVSGTPVTLPAPTTDAACFSGASKTQVVFTVTGRGAGGGESQAKLCVEVAAAPGQTPSLSVSRATLTITETATTPDTGTTAFLDSSATFAYAPNGIASVSILLETPDLSAAPATPTDELLETTYSGTGTVTAYAQNADSKIGELKVAGSLAAADVQAFLRSVKYRLQRADAKPGNRIARVIVRDATGVLAYASRVISVRAYNNPPSLTGLTNSVFQEEFDKDSGVMFGTLIGLFDSDDDFMSTATVRIATTAGAGYAACDPSRDFLYLPSTYRTNDVPLVFGVWDAQSCSLALRPVTGNTVSKSGMRSALRAVTYISRNRKDSTNSKYDGVDGVTAAENTRRISVTVTDAGANGGVSTPATSAAINAELTLTPYDDAPQVDLATVYAEGGLFYEKDAFANVKVLSVGSPAVLYKLRKFVAAIDMDTPAAFSLPISLDLAKVSDGVFAGGQITDVDTKNPLGASDIVFTCTSGPDGGACTGDLTFTTSLADTDPVAKYNAEEGLSTFRLEIAAPHAFSDANLGEFVFSMQYGVGGPTVDFAVDIRKRACRLDADFNPATRYPDASKCSISTTNVAVPEEDTTYSWGGYSDRIEFVAGQLEALSEMSTQLQLDAFQFWRQHFRGMYAVTFPANSFATVDALPFKASPAVPTSTALLPSVLASEEIDAGAAIKLEPACATFSKPLRVCAFVGDTPAGFTRTFRIASQLDCLDETKGYSELTEALDVEWNPVTGIMCGSTTHFSIIVPVLVPVVQAPTEGKLYTMGGSCPNDCSGHGYCRQEGKCTCFAGFFGYDCADRNCPAAESWGSAEGIAHKSEECSGRGTCNTASGTCQCMPGFEGPACERTQCPNDCSGHGRCRLLSELPKVQESGYSAWEANRVQVCRCDGGYAGNDCSERICAFGDDPETVLVDTNRQVQILTIDFGTIPNNNQASTIPASVYEVDEVALVFRTLDGTNFTTPRISDIFEPDNGGVAKLTTALKALPNFAVSDVVVSKGIGSNSAGAESPYVAYHITFDGTSMSVDLTSSASSRSNTGANTVSGEQNLLQCAVAPSGSMGCTSAGCRPMFHQLRILETPSTLSGVTINPEAILVQPDELNAGDAAEPGRWGVAVTITVAADGVNSDLTYSATSLIYEEGTGTAGAAATLDATPLPPASLRPGVPILYGLVVDFDAGVVPGVFEFKWRLPTCSVSLGTAADRDYEALECSGRGMCDRGSGTCSCFPGYAGYNCGQQTIII